MWLETLHRISAMRNRDREVIGLTYRVGRHVAGAANMIPDIIARIVESVTKESTQPVSLLLVGPPGIPLRQSHAIA